MFSWIRRRRQRKQTAQNIYDSIVAQARLPVFYDTLNVPDTLEGRFEILVVHVFLASEALQGAGDEEIELRRALVDLFAADMDATMRELGISDMRVPKKMRAISEALLDRMQSYRAVIDENDRSSLIDLLARHLSESAGDDALKTQVLADYIFSCHALLTDEASDFGVSRELAFAPVSAAENAHA